MRVCSMQHVFPPLAVCLAQRLHSQSVRLCAKQPRRRSRRFAARKMRWSSATNPSSRQDHGAGCNTQGYARSNTHAQAASKECENMTGDYSPPHWPLD